LTPDASQKLFAICFALSAFHYLYCSIPFAMKRFPFYVGILLFVTCCTKAQDFDTKNIKKHITTLADDSFQGRGTGTAGEKAASDYISSAFKSLKLQPKGNDGSFLQSFPFRSGAHGEGEAGTANNVVGYLDNQATTTIIIGAHYDHLGTDGQGSSLDANPKEKIHNGADDNASGVAGVIELARYFSTNKKKEKANFLFLCFSGEEMGLLGSKFVTENSPVDLTTVNYMINMDMIGRLDPQTKTLMVHGTGTSPVWETLLKKLETPALVIKTDSSGTGPSDHTSFYLKNIPVLHFFTGSHSDYHKPSDDADKINYEGESEVLKLIAKIIDDLDSQPKLAFLQTKSKATTSRSSFKVTLGIMPSYSSSGDGLKVDGVTDGRPGHKAGIKTGDVIIQMGEYPIKDIENYMDALGKFEKGQTALVRVKRGSETLDLTVVF
jgi:hypothetical protein